MHVLRIESVYFNALNVYMPMFVLSTITRAIVNRARARARARAFQTTIFAISRKCVFS